MSSRSDIITFEAARPFDYGTVHYRIYRHQYAFNQLIDQQDSFRLGLRLRHGTTQKFELPAIGVERADDFKFPVCIPPGVPLRVSGSSGEEHSILLNFLPELFQTITGKRLAFNNSELSSMLAVPDRNLINTMSRLAEELLKPKMASDFAINSLANTAVVDFCRCIASCGTEETRRRGKLAFRHETIIQERILADGPAPTVDELAHLCNMSGRSLTRLFKHATGTTLQDFIQKTKMDRAREMLSSSDLCLKEISYKLGFSSPSSFSTAFKRLAGHSPLRYRRVAEAEQS